MPRFTFITLALVSACLCFAESATAQDRQRGRRQRSQAVEVSVEIFSRAERQLFRDYFAQHEFEVRPLPPGIARNLARGKPLPPGIAKRQLPTNLAARLPTRTGVEVEVTIFGDRIVLLEASGLVVDILEGVFGGG